MMGEIKAKDFKPGDVVALPFGKRATVKSVKFGTLYATVTWEEPYMDSRYELNQHVLLEGDE